MQIVLTFIIVALAVAYAGNRILRRLRGKGNACSCEHCPHGCKSAEAASPTCTDCPLQSGCSSVRKEEMKEK